MLRHESSNSDGTHVPFDEAQTLVASFCRVAPNNFSLLTGSVYLCVCVRRDQLCRLVRETSLFRFHPPLLVRPAKSAGHRDLRAMRSPFFLLVSTPGKTQGQLYPLLHCIKPIIPHQGLFSVTAHVLFTPACKKKKKKSVASRVSSTAQTADIVNMFFSPLPTRG